MEEPDLGMPFAQFAPPEPKAPIAEPAVFQPVAEPILPVAPPPAAPPAAAASAPERPSLAPIPIKGRSGGEAPPGVIPIAKRPGTPEPSSAPEPPRPAAPTVQPFAAPQQPVVPAVSPSYEEPAIGQAPPVAPRSAPGGVPIQPLRPVQPSPQAQPLNRGSDLTGGTAGAAPTVAASGRTWYCRFCGMQSQSADQCTWCHHDLKSLPPSAGKPIHVVSSKTSGPRRGGQAVAAPPGPRSVPGASRPVRHEVAAPAPAPSSNGSGKPAIGTFQAAKSKYYADKVFDPVSQSHYDADSGRADGDLPQSKIVVEETSDLRQLAKYAIVFGIILIAVGVVGNAMPRAYLPILGVATFLAGIMLPVLRVAPFMSDDSTHIAVAIALMLIFGPFVGAMFYGVLWVIQGEANPAIVGIFLSYILIRLVADASTGHDIADLFRKMLPDLDLARWVDFAARWMPLAGVLGWMCGDPFKKPDE